MVRRKSPKKVKESLPLPVLPAVTLVQLPSETISAILKFTLEDISTPAAQQVVCFNLSKVSRRLYLAVREYGLAVVQSVEQANTLVKLLHEEERPQESSGPEGPEKRRIKKLVLTINSSTISKRRQNGTILELLAHCLEVEQLRLTLPAPIGRSNGDLSRGLGTVWKKMVDVRSLELQYNGKGIPDDECPPFSSFPNLAHFTATSQFFKKWTLDAHPQLLPNNLTSINVGIVSVFTHTLRFVADLMKASQQSLRSLDLQCYTSPQHPSLDSVVDALRAVAQNLVHLSFGIFSFDKSESLLPIYESMVNLKSFQFHDFYNTPPYLTVLAHLPLLEEVIFTNFSDVEDSTIATYILNSSPTLKRVTLLGGGWIDVKWKWENVKAASTHRGIQLAMSNSPTS